MTTAVFPKPHHWIENGCVCFEWIEEELPICPTHGTSICMASIRLQWFLNDQKKVALIKKLSKEYVGVQTWKSKKGTSYGAKCNNVIMYGDNEFEALVKLDKVLQCMKEVVE